MATYSTVRDARTRPSCSRAAHLPFFVAPISSGSFGEVLSGGARAAYDGYRRLRLSRFRHGSLLEVRIAGKVGSRDELCQRRLSLFQKGFPNPPLHLRGFCSPACPSPQALDPSDERFIFSPSGRTRFPGSSAGMGGAASFATPRRRVPRCAGCVVGIRSYRGTLHCHAPGAWRSAR